MLKPTDPPPASAEKTITTKSGRKAALAVVRDSSDTTRLRLWIHARLLNPDGSPMTVPNPHGGDPIPVIAAPYQVVVASEMVGPDGAVLLDKLATELERGAERADTRKKFLEIAASFMSVPSDTP